MQLGRKFQVSDMHDSDKLKDEIFQCLIDIVSTCNLTCPTCPQGNMDTVGEGQMKLNDFKKIVKKLKNDYPNLKTIKLYNWTEPFLHNKLPEFIETAKNVNLKCNLSTNLNHVRNLEEVIKKHPDTIVISLSGFTQSVYQIGHRSGNIEDVKNNMKTLSKTIKKYSPNTEVTVTFHKYKHNLSEIQLMKKFALDLGFNFHTFWAYYMTVEMLLQYISSPEKIDKDTMNVIKSLGNEPKEFLNSLKPFDKGRCHLLENDLVLNAAGEVQLCCASLTPIYLKEKYLDLTPEEIYLKRHSSNLCKTCMNSAIHTMTRTKWSDDEMIFSSTLKKNKLTRKSLQILRNSIHHLKKI